MKCWWAKTWILLILAGVAKRRRTSLGAVLLGLDRHPCTVGPCEFNSLAGKSVSSSVGKMQILIHTHPPFCENQFSHLPDTKMTLKGIFFTISPNCYCSSRNPGEIALLKPLKSRFKILSELWENFLCVFFTFSFINGPNCCTFKTLDFFRVF